MNVEFIMNNFDEHDIDIKDMEKLINKFIKHHKKLIKSYDKDATFRNGLLSQINKAINNQLDPADYVMCIAYDTDIERAIGYIFAQKKDLNNSWSIPSTYLDEDYRGVLIGDSRISAIMWNYLEEALKGKGCSKVHYQVYECNQRVLKSIQRYQSISLRQEKNYGDSALNFNRVVTQCERVPLINLEISLA